jgi:hypothetical protein
MSMDRTETDMLAALERLSATMDRLASSRPPSAPTSAATEAGRTVRPESRPSDLSEAHWNRIAETFGNVSAKALAATLGRGRMDSTVGGGRPATRLGRAASWIGQTRPVRAVRSIAGRVRGTKAGRTATRAVGWVGGSLAGRTVGRMVGSLGGPAGAILGGLVGGGVGAAVGSRASGGPFAAGGRGGLAGGATGAAVGGLLGGVPGAVGGGLAGAAIGGAASGAAKALGEFVHETEEASRQLMTVNRSLAQFSGQMAVVAVREQVREISRERERGDRLAYSANRLMESDQRRKDNVKELEILGQRIDNWVTSIKNDIASGITAPLNEIAGVVNQMLGDEKAENVLGAKMLDLKGEKNFDQLAAEDRLKAQRQREAIDAIVHWRRPPNRGG